MTKDRPDTEEEEEEKNLKKEGEDEGNSEGKDFYCGLPKNVLISFNPVRFWMSRDLT